MSVVEQLGVEFDDLYALLQIFMEVSLPSNEDLQSKREQMTAVAHGVTAASASCRAGLAVMNEHVTSLGQRATSEEAKFATSVAAFHQAMTRSSTEVNDSAKAALQQLDACAQKNSQVGQATREIDGAVSKSFTVDAAAISTTRDALTALSVMALTAHEAERTSAQRAQHELDERGTSGFQHLEQAATAAHEHGKNTIPGEFKEVADWVRGDLGQLHLSAISESGDQAAQYLQRFGSEVVAAGQQCGQETSQAFSKAGQAIVDSRQNMHHHVNRRTQTLLDQMARAQQSIAQTFDPGIEKAQKCSQQFGEVEHHLAELRPHL